MLHRGVGIWRPRTSGTCFEDQWVVLSSVGGNGGYVLCDDGGHRPAFDFAVAGDHAACSMLVRVLVLGSFRDDSKEWLTFPLLQCINMG